MNWHKNFFNTWHGLDKKTLFFTLMLCMFSIFITCSISPAIAKRINVYKFQFAFKHVFFLLFSISLMLIIATMKQDFIIKFSMLAFVVLVIMLLAVIIFGAEIKGARRWIKLPFIVALQPSELLKPFFVVVNALILRNLNSHRNRKLAISAAGLLIIDILLIGEPDFGMFCMYSFIWIAQVFIAGFPLKHLVKMLLAIIAIMIVLIASLPHTRQRIISFAGGNGELKYQVEKALQSMAEGGNFGKGPGDGSIKFQLPDVHTDYIFAAIGEEFGYIICLLITLVYFFIVIHNLLIAKSEPDMLKANIIIGIALMFGLQAFINLGVSINLLPSKGMTLPFISYGGSACIGMGISFGILLALTSRNSSYNSKYNLY